MLEHLKEKYTRKGTVQKRVQELVLVHTLTTSKNSTKRSGLDRISAEVSVSTLTRIAREDGSCTEKSTGGRDGLVPIVHLRE